MKKVLFVLVCSVILMPFWVSHSDAQMCGCMGERMHGGGMMGGMTHEGMGMMHEMGGGMRGGDHPMWRMLKGLNLDDQQRETLKAIKSRVMKEMIRKRADLQIAHMEQRELLDKDPVDMKAVEAKLRQIESMRTDMHLSMLKAMEDVKAKLTPEQRKKFREMMERGPMMGRMGMGMRGCPDCGMMEGGDCHMMRHGHMEREMSQPSEEEEMPGPEGHRHH